MAYRGDGEPEYIDDDEFYDPDEFGDVGGRRSNVLGGSGSRQARREDNERAEERRRGGGAGRKPLKARNPAPSVANSEERRARLAGKHQKKSAPSESPPRPETGKTDIDAAEGKSSGWRGRFARRDKSTREAAEPGAGSKSSRIASVAGKIGALRGGSRRDDSKDDGGGNRRGDGDSGGSTSGNLGGRRFGSSRGATQPQDNQPGGIARARASKTPKIASDEWLDLDRKLDLIGVGLVFGAIVFVFSALSPEQAAIGGLHAIIGQLLGWGAAAAPVLMFAVGLWLIIRHFGDAPPIIDPARLSGAALAFLGALVLFQFLDSFGYPEQCGQDCIGQALRQSYQDGRGGGLIGGWLYSALVINLTEIGAFVAVLMALTIAAMLTTRSSVAELSVVVISLSRNLRTRVEQVIVQRRAARLQAQQEQLTTTRQDEGHVRIRKPEPAQLSASPAGAAALPEPRGDWMPIPSRLRAFLVRRAKAESEPDKEPVAVEPPAETVNKGMMRRILNRVPTEDAPATPEKPRERAGRLERFLNLGDNLPPAAAEPPSADLSPPAPRPRRVTPPPPVIRSSPRAPIKPIEPPRPTAKPVADAGSAESENAPKKMKAPPAESKPPDKKQETTFKEAPAAVSTKPANGRGWDLPDYRDLLNAGSASELDEAALQRQAQIIEDTLASFGAPGRVVEVNSGPVITQYGVEPAYITAKTGKRNRVKVGAIAKLDKDLQLALGARSLRMEAPVPGKGYVGIEVPNPVSARVGLRDVMDSSAYERIESPLAIALGMSVDGRPMAADLTQMPHLLIAGTTGSGKSVCVNAIINSILVNNSPESVRFIMVDPKRVELTGYNGLPHLVAPVVVELERIIGVLRWVTTEMDERYKKFSQAGARNIIDYNSILEADQAAMPYIVVIIDELADLMMMVPDDTERAIARIAALARATGIHLVIATQRPSVDVVTGLIKANCPARIAFAVASSVDSRVIIDQPGAERLLGKGDMLYLSGNAPAPQRAQGVHVSNEEIQRISRFWKLRKSGIAGIEPIPLPPKSSSTRPRPAAANSAPKKKTEGQAAFWDTAAGQDDHNADGKEQEEDELYQTAVDMVRRLDKASISLLQRRLRIGYTRAARLVDMMEERGVVGPPKEGSSKPRDVLKQ